MLSYEDGIIIPERTYIQSYLQHFDIDVYQKNDLAIVDLAILAVIVVPSKNVIVAIVKTKDDTVAAVSNSLDSVDLTLIGTEAMIDNLTFVIHGIMQKAIEAIRSNTFDSVGVNIVNVRDN